jgi:hypothetical protein
LFEAFTEPKTIRYPAPRHWLESADHDNSEAAASS